MDPVKYDINTLGQAPAPGAAPTPTISKELLALLKALGGEDGAVEFKVVEGGVIDIGTFKDLKIFNPDGSIKITLDASNPQVAEANEILISLYVSSLMLEGTDGSPDPNRKIILDLIEGLNTTVVNPAVLDGMGKSQGNAFLGGLVMVALADILAEFAKTESGIKKLASNLFLESQACMKDLAEAQARNIEGKAKAQADAKILQAVITAVTTTIQLGMNTMAYSKLERKPDMGPDGFQKTKPETITKLKFEADGETPVMKKALDVNGNEIPVQKVDARSGKPLHKSNEPDYKGTKPEDIEADGVDDLGRPVDAQGRVLKPSTEPKMVQDSETETVDVLQWLEPETAKAQILKEFGAIAAQFGQASSNLVEARSILAAGQADASNQRLCFLQEQMGKMQDVFSKMGNDADQKVGEIWDLLKGMFSAIAQAFKLK
jgi:hypothetical protein